MCVAFHGRLLTCCVLLQDFPALSSKVVIVRSPPIIEPKTREEVELIRACRPHWVEGPDSATVAARLTVFRRNQDLKQVKWAREHAALFGPWQPEELSRVPSVMVVRRSSAARRLQPAQASLVGARRVAAPPPRHSFTSGCPPVECYNRFAALPTYEPTWVEDKLPIGKRRGSVTGA
jgi:hypothetical protein